MKFYYCLYILLLILAGCSKQSGEDIRAEKLIGVWHLMDYGSGNYSYSTLGFTADGRKCVISIEMNRSGYPIVDYYLNSWVIEGNILVTTVGSSPSNSLPRGYVIEDEIMNLDEDKMDLEMRVPVTGKPRLERHVKLYAENSERICEVVQNFADFKK